MNRSIHEVQETNTVAAPEAATTTNAGRQAPDHEVESGNARGAAPDAGDGWGGAGRSVQPKPAKTPDEYEQMIAELRKENAGHRHKLREFEASEAKRREAEMTESERAQARIKELEEQASALERHALDSQIMAHAAAMKFSDPSDAAAFIDRDRIEEGGRNVPELLKEVLKAKPYLARDPLPATSSANPGSAAERASDKAREDELRQAFPSLARRM